MFKVTLGKVNIDADEWGVNGRKKIPMKKKKNRGKKKSDMRVLEKTERYFREKKKKSKIQRCATRETQKKKNTDQH